MDNANFQSTLQNTLLADKSVAFNEKTLFPQLSTLQNVEHGEKLENSLRAREVLLKRDPVACMDVLKIKFGDPDVHLICLDGIVAVHSFIIRNLSSFLDNLFDQQGANFPEVRKVLLPDFKSAIVEKATKVMYSGLVLLNSNIEADFILEIFEVFKIDRFDRLSITLHSDSESKKVRVDNVLQEVVIKEENLFELHCEVENCETLTPTITSVQSIPMRREPALITKKKELNQSSVGIGTDPVNEVSNPVGRPTRTLRPRNATKRINEKKSEADAPVEVEKIRKNGIKTEATTTELPPNVEVHKNARKTSNKAKSRAISSDEEEYALENSLSSSTSDSEEDPEYVAPDSDEDPEYIAPKKPKLWMPPKTNRTKPKPQVKFGALRLARKERITALFQKAVASREQKAMTNTLARQGSSNLLGNHRLPVSSSIGGEFGSSATAALQALSTRHQSLKSGSIFSKPMPQALPALEKNFAAKPPIITAGGMLITPLVNSLPTIPTARLAPPILSPAPSNANVTKVKSSGLAELAFNLRTECAERYLDRELYLKHAKICGKCGKEFANIREAADCLQKHKVVRCYFCFAIFPSTEVLFEHYSVTHGSACPICHKIVPFQNASLHAIKDHLFEKKSGAACNNANVRRTATTTTKEGSSNLSKEEGFSILGIETEIVDHQESIRVIEPTSVDPDTHVVLCDPNFSVKIEGEDIEEEDAEPFSIVNYS